MRVELAGLIVAALGMVALALPVQRAFYFMAISTVFGAAAAFNLPALGGASVLVASLMLVFFCARLLMAAGAGQALASFASLRPGFWLLLLTVYGVFTAIFYPRLFEGLTETMTVFRSAAGYSSISLNTLGPSSGNVTQPIYALGGLACFAAAFAFFRRVRSLLDLCNVMIVVSFVNLAFAALDVLTYWTNTAYLLDFVRTANYSLLTASEIGGLKRISGTFSEASAFAGYTLVLFGFVSSLWLDRVRQMLTGPLAVLLLLALLLSTSATAYVGLAVVAAVLIVRSLLHRESHGNAVFVALAVPLVVTSVSISPDIADQVTGFFNETLFQKLGSESGEERLMWNAVAFQNFKDTWGFGAGLGSARASGYLFVLLSNVGVIGTFLFIIFIGSLLLDPSGSRSSSLDSKAARAAKIGMIATVTVALISGTIFDLGLNFYLLAGAVAARSGLGNVTSAPIASRDLSHSIRHIGVRS